MGDEQLGKSFLAARRPDRTGHQLRAGMGLERAWGRSEEGRVSALK